MQKLTGKKRGKEVFAKPLNDLDLKGQLMVLCNIYNRDNKRLKFYH